MTQLAATAKGSATRDAIIDRAHEIARCAGLEGLSIGPLAQSVGMSKSGVFAHFGSREDLQLAVLEEAARRFGDSVLVPALSKPRGLPRLRAARPGAGSSLVAGPRRLGTSSRRRAPRLSPGSPVAPRGMYAP